MATPQGGADASSRTLRFRWFNQMLGLFPPGRLIDLGAGHGMFARAAADVGWTVTALDARGDRYPADERRIDWQIGDVRDVDLSAFDVIACLGLFYHLTIDDQLDLLARAKGAPIILDTHVANDRPVPTKLSPPVELRGYVGRLYTEPDQATHSPASWGNDQSFWPRTRDLYKMLDAQSYDVLTATPWYLPSRTFFLCLPRREEAG
jgi:SAM-dependent methyltransferase